RPRSRDEGTGPRASGGSKGVAPPGSTAKGLVTKERGLEPAGGSKGVAPRAARPRPRDEGTGPRASGGSGGSPPRASTSMRQVDPLLGTCPLTELRQRQSSKWRESPPDVLPAFVAEMDFSLAEPIITAVASALAFSDCGYAHPGRLADAFAQFAADRLEGAPEAAHL